jgi:hypothetical protein
MSVGVFLGTGGPVLEDPGHSRRQCSEHPEVPPEKYESIYVLQQQKFCVSQLWNPEFRNPGWQGPSEVWGDLSMLLFP